MTSASQLLQSQRYSLTNSSRTPSACTFDVMTGYGTTGTTGNQTPIGTTGTHPVHTDQGGYLGQAQGWATRVTGNLQGQLGEMKSKIVGDQGSSGTAGGTGTGYHPTGTGTGYGATNTGMSHSTPGNPPYSDANTGHNANVGFVDQTQPVHHTQPMSQGYAPTQAKTGCTAGGTYGSTATKPSYTDQAKQYTAKGADMLHGQAEYLKSKLVGTQGTAAPGATATNSGYSQGSGTGHGQMGTHTHRAGDPAMQTAAGAPQAKKSWTESAKQGIATGLTYTQQGLEVVKNKVGGPSTPGTAGTGSTSHSTGHSTNSTVGAQPGLNAGSQHGYGANVQPGHNAGSQAGFNAGSQPGYNAGHHAGAQPGYDAGAQPGYNAGAQPDYNTGNPNQKY